MLDMKEVIEKIPEECPYCREIDDVGWTEFEVYAAEPLFIDAKTKEVKKGLGVPMVIVLCTRCESEIVTKEKVM